MKILIVRTYPSVLNIDNYNSQEIGLAKAFVRAGHTCDICYYAGNVSSYVQNINFDNDKEIKIFWLRSFSILKNGFFLGLNKIVKQYDLIQVSEYDQITSWYLYTFSNKPVYVYHGPYDSDISKKHLLKCKIIDLLLLNKKNTNKTMVFTKSELASDSVRKHGFKNVVTVGVGLDFDRLINDSDSIPPFCEKLASEKCDEGYKLITYIGVLEERRNIKFLFEVFAEVAKKEDNARLLVIGTGKQNYVNECFEYAEQLNILNKIIYIKSLSQAELSSVYKISDVFVLPTKFEIFGMVLLESMLLETPVVTSLNGGSSTLITEQKYGTIVQEFKVDKWADAVLAYLHDENLSLNTAKAAKERIISDFSWNKIADKILKANKDKIEGATNE